MEDGKHGDTTIMAHANRIIQQLAPHQQIKFRYTFTGRAGMAKNVTGVLLSSIGQDSGNIVTVTSQLAKSQHYLKAKIMPHSPGGGGGGGRGGGAP